MNVVSVMRKLLVSVLAAADIAAGAALSAGAAHADEGWVGPFSSSWTCEQNAFSYGWDATCERGGDGWYWWSPAQG
ncbi:hypothetical protein [Tsukamurella paurometabola]|uniref:Secreted protein n=1 Tax=Tsukamurella paurometabola TaxID=2061 RepID=A0ABS5NG60_TSUPA|nr:hypothetical protein [Tsukamurella paurometabola]MBS4102918.1 hypothetical protein [Tsukamurella paurometabola]